MLPAGLLGAHFAYIMPLVAVCVCHARGRRCDDVTWLLATAIAVSFVANTLAFFANIGWELGHYYPALQISIVVFALSKARTFRVMVIGGLVILSVLSAIQIAPADPEVVVRVGGAILVCFMVWPKHELGMLRTAILVYFGIGAIVQLTQPLVARTSPEALVLWYGYQMSCLAGIGIMMSHIIKPPSLKLVGVP